MSQTERNSFPQSNHSKNFLPVLPHNTLETLNSTEHTFEINIFNDHSQTMSTPSYRAKKSKDTSLTRVSLKSMNKLSKRPYNHRILPPIVDRTDRMKTLDYNFLERHVSNIKPFNTSVYDIDRYKDKEYDKMTLLDSKPIYQQRLPRLGSKIKLRRNASNKKVLSG